MSRGNCPICMEDIHTSRIPSHIPSCGHLIHRTCFDALVRGGHYACPVCQKSMLNMESYFCAECKLYDDEDKKQYHCLGCGICRVGGQERFFHCQKCDMCLPKKLEDNHQCIENMSRGNCPICMEDIHTSRIPSHIPSCGHLIHRTCFDALVRGGHYACPVCQKSMLNMESCIENMSRGNCPICMEDIHTSRIPSHIPSCGHLIHRTCFDALVRGGHYACPVCQKSMLNMESVWRSLDEEIAATPMPPEYANYFIGILCKDCHQESSVRFHPVGAKCRSCGSYNTCRSSNPELFTEPPEVATRRGTGFGEVIRVSHGRGRANSEPVVETSDGSVNSSEETGDS
ncbi:hypothetical protein QYM36_002829 [Artemia franciscana]|nr:hypothetical protein QYM36_002829 [Artemia franciscana]